MRVRDDALLLYTSRHDLAAARLPPHARGDRAQLDAASPQILRLGAGDRMWAPCPLFHLGAIGPLIACAAVGAAFVSDTFFEPAPRARADRSASAPPTSTPPTRRSPRALLDQPGVRRRPTSRSARVMLNVGPEDLLRQMQAAMPDVVQVTLYGSTEGGGAITYSQLDDDLDTRVTTCGLPLPGCEVRIADPETGAEVGVDDDGRDPGAQLRALRATTSTTRRRPRPPSTRTAGTRTGDRGSLDADGRLRFLGRLKDMLKVGGENVAAAEIESLLSTHPAVQLVQIVGVPDAAPGGGSGGVRRAARRPRGDRRGADRVLRERIARFKVPRHVRFVSEWPMSATKIQKGPLRERLIAETATKRLVDFVVRSTRTVSTEGVDE